MVKTTREQRRALGQIYRRVLEAQKPGQPPVQYRAFRKTVQPTIGCDGCIMVPAYGMWLGIERDGYTHS